MQPQAWLHGHGQAAATAAAAAAAAAPTNQQFTLKAGTAPQDDLFRALSVEQRSAAVVEQRSAAVSAFRVDVGDLGRPPSRPAGRWRDVGRPGITRRGHLV